VGERGAAEYALGLLEDVGYDPLYLESRPTRGTIILRVEGSDSSRPALVVHGHLDVVPAVAADWQVDPFGAEIRDGCVWGRGAVDMKDMDAMILTLLLDMKRSGWRPSRDLIVAFFADEEAGGRLGAHWIVEHRPHLLAGASEAIGEVGGFSTTVAGRRAYLLQTAEKGLMWLRLVARGTAGHGSVVSSDNAVAHLARAVAAMSQAPWPVRLTPTVRALLEGVAQLTGLPLTEDPADLAALVAALGPAAAFVAPTLSTTCNPTSLAAGQKVNVIPSRAEATCDIRHLPGTEAEVRARLRDTITAACAPAEADPSTVPGAVGGGPTSPAADLSQARDTITLETINEDIGVQAPVAGPLMEAMTAAIGRADPGAAVLPYMLCAGTDAKSLSLLGIDCYGFVPLRLPADFDFPAMFHGVDERVPVESLTFGVEVLADFLRHA
jgi:acetylornithine deacetylase/succinyl-diaminopimelate desuccinylase-like protein